MIETDVQFSALKSHLNKAGLMDKLDEPGQWTLFAPTNKAFSNLDAVSEHLKNVFKKVDKCCAFKINAPYRIEKSNSQPEFDTVLALTP